MAEAAPLGFQDPLIAAGVVGLEAFYATNTATPLEAVDAYLRRIERLNSLVNAFLFVDGEGAMRDAEASAARWACGARLSPLDGVPVGVKANIAVREMPWHAGIAAYREQVADQDAECVAALRKGGAVILGVLNMHEAALGATTDNLAFGRCHNPYRYDFTAGGSSGGSAAAVAAGLCAVALGTDTMGSVRIPASYCGLFGHMAKRGGLSSAGVIPLSWTLDQMGILARSAQDGAATLSVLGGHAVAFDDVDRSSITLAALDLSGEVELDPDIEGGFNTVLETARSAGIAVRPLRLTSYDLLAMRKHCLIVAEVEGFIEHQSALADDPGGFSPALSGMLHWAAKQPSPKLAEAYRRLSLCASLIALDLAPFDGLLTPTTSTPAFSFEEPTPPGQADFTLIANIAGFAATAFPTGLTRDDLPQSAQFISRSGVTSLRHASRLARLAPPPERFRP